MIATSLRSPNLRLHNGRLLLTPEDPMAAAPSASLAARLLEAGLIASARSTGGGPSYRPGSRFFEYIGFTGCAVQLDQEPNGEAEFEIRLEGPFATPEQRLGRNSRAPRCPQCRRPLADWREHIEHPTEATQPRLQCSSCGASAPSCSWDWGRHGGFGRLFIKLEPVFPGEGRPLPALFTLLERMELGPWRHFYVQD